MNHCDIAMSYCIIRAHTERYFLAIHDWDVSDIVVTLALRMVDPASCR